MIINLSSITNNNAHAALVRAGHKEYCVIYPHRLGRNLLGSPLANGPSNLLQYRAWLWSQIQSENGTILSALRRVAVCGKVVHENQAEIAELISKAAKWYKEKVLQPAIVCTKCLVYLTDANAGDGHLCTECAWSGNEDSGGDDNDEHLSHFCGDCQCILTSWYSQMYGQCKPCRHKEERKAQENFDESKASLLPYRPNGSQKKESLTSEWLFFNSPLRQAQSTA